MLTLLVFLRVLEYYNGILFLTTNRAGALDEAFKSRVQVSIYYPPLSETQTREIWQMNLDRLKTIEEQRCKSTHELPLEIFDNEIMEFAMNHYHHHSQTSRWNGRQIRNSFQIASSLAYYESRKRYARLLEEDHETVRSRPILGADHFRTIAKLTSVFDEYMLEALGQDHAQIAYEDGARADHFKGPEPDEPVAGSLYGHQYQDQRGRNRSFENTRRFGNSGGNADYLERGHPDRSMAGSPPEAFPFPQGPSEPYPYRRQGSGSAYFGRGEYDHAPQRPSMQGQHYSHASQHDRDRDRDRERHRERDRERDRDRDIDRDRDYEPPSEGPRRYVYGNASQSQLDLPSASSGRASSFRPEYGAPRKSVYEDDK